MSKWSSTVAPRQQSKIYCYHINIWCQKGFWKVESGINANMLAHNNTGSSSAAVRRSSSSFACYCRTQHTPPTDQHTPLRRHGAHATYHSITHPDSSQQTVDSKSQWLSSLLEETPDTLPFPRSPLHVPDIRSFHRDSERWACIGKFMV
jgi:hypothetical protein